MADEFVDEERVSMEEDAALGSGGAAEEEVALEEGMESPEGHQTEAAAGPAAATGNADINIESFNELIVPADIVTEAQRAWQLLISAAGSKEAVGEAFYQAFYDPPSLELH